MRATGPACEVIVGQVPNLVITHIFRSERFLPFAMKGLWILAGDAIPGTVRKQSRAPVGAAGRELEHQGDSPESMIRRPLQGAAE